MLDAKKSICNEGAMEREQSREQNEPDQTCREIETRAC